MCSGIVKVFFHSSCIRRSTRVLNWIRMSGSMHFEKVFFFSSCLFLTSFLQVTRYAFQKVKGLDFYTDSSACEVKPPKAFLWIPQSFLATLPPPPSCPLPCASPLNSYQVFGRSRRRFSNSIRPSSNWMIQADKKRAARRLGE